MVALRRTVARLRFGSGLRREIYADLLNHMEGGATMAVALARMGSSMNREPGMAGTPEWHFVTVAFEGVRGGKTFAQATAGWLPAWETAVIAEAESNGDARSGIREVRMRDLSHRRGTPVASVPTLALRTAVASALIAGALTVGLNAPYPARPSANVALAEATAP